MRFYRGISGFMLLAMLPNIASAHLVSTRFGEFYSGLLHPLAALAHLVPWLALGLLAALQPPSTSRWALLSFPLAVAIGSILGSSLPAAELVDSVNLASMALIGLMVALAPRLSPTAFIVVTACVGVSHGYANSAATLFGSDRLLYILGVVTAAYMLMALITATATVLRQNTRWGLIAVRALGSWIVAVGVLYGGYSLLMMPGIRGA